MARYPFIKRGGALYPRSAEAEEAMRVVRDGREVMVTFHTARNPGQHRLLFAMLNFVLEHSDQFDDKDTALVGLKIACGLVDTYIDERGKCFFIPRSIAFESMPQDEFAAFFDRAVHVIADRWMPAGTTPESVRSELLAMMEPPQAQGRAA